MLTFCLTAYAPAMLHSLRLPHTHAGAQVVASLPSAPDTAQQNASALKSLPAGSASLSNPQAPLTIQQFRENGVPFTMVIGGRPGSRRSMIREGVEDFVRQAGATAGLNGTFFANASLTGNDNLLIGPSLCQGDSRLVASPFDDKPQLTGRPMVLLAPDHTDIVPYQKGIADNDVALHSFLPGMSDAFLGGVWLVHNGVAADLAGIESFNVKDAMDPRRRAFFAVMQDGRPALGATTYVASSEQLASALQKAGVQEAVLLDSGFSTSLVFQDKILVTGHTAPGIPSRPVPQALLLFGQPTAATTQLAQSLTTSVPHGLAADVVASRPSHRHHRRLVS